MSEVQEGKCSMVQFEELLLLRCNESHVRLCLLGKYPDQTRDVDLRREWVYLTKYEVSLKSLIWVGKDLDIEYGSSIHYNVPIFEFSDGYYMLKVHAHDFVLPDKSISVNLPTKSSFTFNGLLKLNKILQYISQVRQETRDSMKVIEDNFVLVGQEKVYFEESIKRLTERLRRSEERIKETKNEISRGKTCSSQDSANSGSISDDYGSEYSTFVQDKSKLLTLQKRKLLQLISIVPQLNLSSFIEYDKYKIHEQAFSIEFQPVDYKKIVNSTDKERINSQLGNYVLFIKVLSEHILFIPLPHGLLFHGSNSLVNDRLPFFVASKPNQQHFSELKLAVESFNININQLLSLIHI